MSFVRVGAALWVTGLVSLLSGCASSEMNDWCDVATQVDADDSIASADKTRVMLERFKPSSTGVKNMVDALDTVQEWQRYAIIENAARNGLGLEDWSCPALKKVLHAPEPPPVPSE